MRNYMKVILLIMFAAVFAGCKTAPEPQTGDATTPVAQAQDTTIPDPGKAEAAAPTPAEASSASAEGSWIFDSQAALDLGVALDAERAVAALIPVEGGTISATGADGTLYTLVIPADALLTATTIGLTPVTSLANMPFGGEATYAVQLSPDGLFLQNYAILTITPAQAIPSGEQLVFGYLGEGSDMILAAPVVDSNEIQIYVQHFSGNGVTKGLLADLEPERQRLGGDIERRLQNEISAALIRARQEGTDGDGNTLTELFMDVLRRYVEQVIKPRVQAAGESCANGQLALQTVLGFQRQVQLLGIQEDFLAGIVDISELMEKAARVCIVEEFELCVEEHIIHRMLPMWLGFQRQWQLMGYPESAALREARDLTVQCLTFRLEFESTGKLEAGGAGYESSVTSEIMLRFDPDEYRISGDAALVNDYYEYYAPTCTTTSVTGNGTFTVFELIYQEEPGASDKYNSGPKVFGHIRDFSLNYHPGTSTEHASMSCPNMGTLPMDLPAWTTAYMVTHSGEVTEQGWFTINWKMLGGELFAEKEWDLASAEVTEAGKFELYHAPGE